MAGGQYGEDVLLLERFKEQAQGFVVEIGAGNGVDNSNSWCLIQKGWGGILIEPEPIQFDALQEFYKDRPDVECVQVAAGMELGQFPFYCGGQVSTLCPTWRDRCIEAHGIDYKEISVFVRPLGDILKKAGASQRIDFLSIDCEGRDFDVLQSMDWGWFDVGLVCTECRRDPYMDSIGFDFIGRTVPELDKGNKFYAKRMAKTPD